MSRKLIDQARKLLAGESGSQIKPWGGRLTVALVFPNTYHQGMSNLGFLTVYHLLNQREDVLCERFFLPDAEALAEHRKTGYPLFSLESGHPLTDFDLIAFSISFENDYLNLPVMFELARLPLWRGDRGDSYPLLLAGGVCAFLNPEPLAEIMDLFAVGEGEVMLPELVATLKAGSELTRPELLDHLAGTPGIYVPSLYECEWAADGTLQGWLRQPAVPARVARQWVRDLDRSASRSFILTEATEFSDMALTEISRGCGRGCRFCAAGYIYLPPRERSLDVLLAQVDLGLCEREKVGLVGAAVSDYSRIAELDQAILDRGGKVSVASLRIDSLTPEEVAALKTSGHRTLALAPEAGSQRMRDTINKGLTREQIVAAVRLLGAGGILNLKLYFLVGLPGETDGDIDEMLDLLAEIRAVWVDEGKKQGRLGTLTISVNPFTPKPFTPFQWAGMAPEKRLKGIFQRLRAAVGRMANTDIIFESARSAALQALLARGDRRVGRLLPDLAAGMNLKAACRQQGLDPDFYVTRERGADEVFPWEIIDSGVRRDFLYREYQAALAHARSRRCFDGCVDCGVCREK